MAKGRTAPATEVAAPVKEIAPPMPAIVVAPAAEAPIPSSIAAAPAQESSAPVVNAAPIPEPVVAKQPVPSAVALSEADLGATQNALPAREAAVPPRAAPAVAKTPDPSWRPFTQRIEHWPQPMAPSVRALDTVDDVVAGDPPKARAPQPAPVSTAVAPTKAPAPSSAPSPVVGKAPDVPKAPAAVSAPPRPAPAVSIAQVPATQPAVDPMGSRRSEVQAPWSPRSASPSRMCPHKHRQPSRRPSCRCRRRRSGSRSCNRVRR